MNRWRLAIVMVIGLVSLTWAGCGKNDASTDKPGAGQTAATAQPPADAPRERFQLKDIQGVQHTWSQFVGKPFIVNFWATWCGPCHAEMPTLKKLYAEYHPRGLEIVSISVDDNRTKGMIPGFIDRYQVPWTVLLMDQQIPSEFNLTNSIPISIFFDAKGRESGRFIGAQPESVFRREIDKLFPSPQ